MPVKVGDVVYDTVKQACERLGISRGTLLSYIKDGIVSEPPTIKKGKTHFRFFPEEWYSENQKKIEDLE